MKQKSKCYFLLTLGQPSPYFVLVVNSRDCITGVAWVCRMGRKNFKNAEYQICQTCYE